MASKKNYPDAQGLIIFINILINFFYLQIIQMKSISKIAKSGVVTAIHGEMNVLE
jgi:hypothetical protein